MAIRGVIFDLFHTLTGPESQWSTLPWTSDVLGIDRRRWNELLLARSRWRLTGEETDPHQIVSILAREADPAIPEECIRRAVDVRVRRFRESLLNVPDANITALTRLRAEGFRLGLISNADASEIASWGESRFAGLFDVEVFSCFAGCVKPEPAIYEKCLEGLGLTAPECLFVGDGGSNELAGARDVGLSTVFVSGVIAELWPETIQARIAIADHHVERMPDVLSLLGVPPAGE